MAAEAETDNSGEDMTGVGSTDTIAAVSTAPGRAAIAVVRVSGPGTQSVAVALGLVDLRARHVSLRRVLHPTSGEGLDRALVSWFPAPASYTGEDMLELSSHGGAIVPASLLDAVCAAGARPANPGEFTRRAYLNGKLDLLQVEATLDLIEARSPRLRRAALFSLERGLSKRIEGLRARLLELQALLAYDIDFPDEDDGPIDRNRIRQTAENLDSELDAMLRLAPEGELLREGALTVIAGRPNSGKSSLFNVLLGVERTIVTDIPGTTRDAIDARSPRLRRAALFSLERGLSKRIEGLRARLLELQALLAYDIDFPDEDDGPIDRNRIRQTAENLDSELDAMLRLAPEGELLREGALTVIAGRPNSGKSSLFNVLLGVERTIVTDIPGTTRDAIEALISVDDYPFRVVDTAGIRESFEQIEGLGIEVARSYLARADLVLFCVDPNQEESMDNAVSVAASLTGHLSSDRVIILYTKSDLDSGFVRQPNDRGICLSVRTGEGLEQLRSTMLGVVYNELREAEEVPLITRGRQSRALGQARESLTEFIKTWSAGHPPEIAAAHLQDAVLPLEEMLGVITNEDVLGALFANFCVGK